METSESDVGYPEEQPPEIDDTPADERPRREAARKRSEDRRAALGDDGTATGNPLVD